MRKRPVGYTERLPSGRHRARRGKKTIGTYDSETEAQAALGWFPEETLTAWFESFALHKRERSGLKASFDTEKKWRALSSDPVARMPLSMLDNAEARAWYDRQVDAARAPQTIRNALQLLTAFCAWLVERAVMAENPFRDIKIPRGFGGASGGVYAIQVGHYVKIGKADNIARRLQNIKCDNPEPAVLLAVLSSDQADEVSFHERFAAYHHRGEWFRLEGELEAALCARAEAAE